MRYTVFFTPEAEAQLIEIFGYLAVEASPEIAASFTDGIVTFCESLSTFPLRGNMRDDIRLGLRVIGYRRRVSVAFHVADQRVNILGIFYGGQDFEAELIEE